MGEAGGEEGRAVLREAGDEKKDEWRTDAEDDSPGLLRSRGEMEEGEGTMRGGRGEKDMTGWKKGGRKMVVGRKGKEKRTPTDLDVFFEGSQVEYRDATGGGMTRVKLRG